MMKIINLIGGREKILIIIAFIGLCFAISSLFNTKKRRLLFSFIASLFITLQLFSLYTTQTFIGYQFYVHFNLRGVVGLSSSFIPQIIIFFIFFLLLCFLNYSSSLLFKKINHILNIKKRQFLSLTSILIFTILTVLTIAREDAFINDTKSLLPVFQFHNNTNFKEVLNENGMQDYITPDQIESKAGDNIIVISMESLEKGFLSEKYASLTPNLNRLKTEWNYIDLEQNSGSTWTSGSLYTYLTGFPAFFGIHGNSVFETAYHSEISSISHVLEKANYETVYLNGNTDHSGVKEMLNALNFGKIIDVNNIKKTGNESSYGIRDKDLFDYATHEIETFQNKNQPFAVFISTTDTHFPDGIYDERMESVISKKESNIEFMVAALDHMIGNFISNLETKNLLKNTTIYIFPDHLKMGDPSMFDDTGERGLYVISNSAIKNTSNDGLKNTYQIDLPKIILEGANIEHNLKFYTDYISGDKNAIIDNNILTLTEINTNGLLRMGANPIDLDDISEHYETYKKDTFRYIAHGGGKIDGNKYTNSKEALDLSYEKGFRLFELDIIKTEDGKLVAAHDWKHWAKITNYKGELPVLHDTFINQKIYNKYTPLNMDAINELFSNHKDAILVTDKINDPIEFAEKFVDKNRLMMELFDMDAVKKGLDIGILSSMPSHALLRNIDNEDVKSWSELGIKHIAISRKFINGNEDLLAEFKKQGIKPYVFHINTTPGIDEEYVTKYEMDYVYGLYADEWSFK